MYANILSTKRRQSYNFFPTYANIFCILFKALSKMTFPYCTYRKTVKTITTDNGSEFASHQLITKGLHIKGKEDVIAYFADAYSSWQKGCVENTNKLIRRYIPKNDFRFQVDKHLTKHTDFNLVSPQKIMNIQKKLNNRPREN